VAASATRPTAPAVTKVSGRSAINRPTTPNRPVFNAASRSLEFFEIHLKDGHVKIVRQIPVLIVAGDDADQFVGVVNLRRISNICAPRSDGQFIEAELFPKVLLHAGDFRWFHSRPLLLWIALSYRQPGATQTDAVRRGALFLLLETDGGTSIA
jgi:hypothetical protein